MAVADFLAGTLLLYATLERVFELELSRRHTRALLADGAYEVGRGHYPFVIGLHVLWLAALWVLLLAGRVELQAWPAILYLMTQGFRVWTMRALGAFWTTRIIVTPHVPLVRTGPYRFLRHPNYLVVVLEIALLPLALGAWPIALGFSVLNAGALLWRYRVEEAALERWR